MKIGIASDIHLEFGDLDLPNKENVDVLVLAGDIVPAELLDKKDAGKHAREFFQRVSQAFPHVIYVMGNHEHYNGFIDRSHRFIKDVFEEMQLKNIYVLEKETKKIDDVTFIGQTLWTDFNRGDSLTLWHCGRAMNDFRVVRWADKNYRRFTSDDALEDHKQALDYLKIVLPTLKDEKVVVVGHHAPSQLSVHPRYLGDELLNGAYRSDLSELILDNPQIKLWVHGHTHTPFDYEIGTTRVVCNPRGYWNYEVFEPGYMYQLFEI